MSRLSTTCDVVAFCSSAGHCQLDCAYCVVHPVIKRNPSLTYDDLAFFLDQVGGRTFLIFSGKGDFFAGYGRRERLLARLLERDVEVALDVNGVLIHEYPELTGEQLAKVRAINLTMHFAQLKDKGAQERWAENARTILERHRGEMILGTILSPLVSDTWEEGLAFYESRVFEATRQKIWLIEDCERAYTPEEKARYDALAARYAHLVEKKHHEDFRAIFEGHEFVLCPAGKNYFRIWNDGRIEGCPYVSERGDAGNLKERRFHRHETYFRCGTPRFCDCYDIAQLGKMRFEEPEKPAPPSLPVFSGSTR